ncbi:MAG TPA: DUF2927 domain-containing protein [Bacillus bacterium]|nr:DUF2927 domain-containing protein [Bacillus sp. (in: firmicutes)]
MKKLISIVSSAILLSSTLGQSTANAASPIQVEVNGAKQSYSQPPIKENNSVLVPLRGIFESLQAEVNWNAQNQQITIQKEDKTISLNIGSKTATVNNNTVSLTTPPKLKNGNTLVPLRFIGESLGAGVDWDEATQTVKITTQSSEQPSNQNNQQKGEASTQPNQQIVKAEFVAFQSQEAMKNKKYETALAKINEAINLDSSNYLYYYNRALIYEALDQADKAIEDYKKTTTLNDKHEQAYEKLANYHLKQVNYDEALPLFTKLIELNPNKEDYYVNRAFLYFNAKGDKTNAKADIEKAIELNPKNKEYPTLLKKYDVQTFTEEEINYFIEIATGSSTNKLKRWDDKMRITVLGDPTVADLATIKSTANEINQLINEDKISVVAQNENPNVELYFIRLNDFEYRFSEANDEDYGQLYVWNQEGLAKNYFKNELNKAVILIAENELNQTERDYFIRKKITQSLGLLHESWKYENSIFYQNDDKPKTLTDLDKQLIKILYYQRLQPGMDAKTIKKELTNS